MGDPNDNHIEEEILPLTTNDEAPQEYPLTDAGEAFYLTGVTRTTSGTNSGVITGTWFRTAIAIYVVQNRLHENGGSFTRQDFLQHIVDSGVLTVEDTAQRGATGGSGSAGHRWKHREQRANQYMRNLGFLTTDRDGNYTVFSGNEQRWRDLAEGYVFLPELNDEEESDEQQTQQEDSQEQAQNQTDTSWTVTYPVSTVTVNVPEGLEFSSPPPSSGSSSSSNSGPSSSNTELTPGFVYVLVRTIGTGRVVHHLVKIGEVEGTIESLDVEQERQQGGSISNREREYQTSTEAVIEDTQGRFIHSEIVAIVPCIDHRRFHEITGIGGALNDAGFSRVGGVSQQEYYRLFDPQEVGDDEEGCAIRRDTLEQVLAVIQQYVDANDECEELYRISERLEAIGLSL